MGKGRIYPSKSSRPPEQSEGLGFGADPVCGVHPTQRTIRVPRSVRGMGRLGKRGQQGTHGEFAFALVQWARGYGSVKEDSSVVLLGRGVRTSLKFLGREEGASRLHSTYVSTLSHAHPESRARHARCGQLMHSRAAFPYPFTH